MNTKNKEELFIRVEYDLNFDRNIDSEYNSIGEFLFIPCNIIEKYNNSIEDAFENYILEEKGMEIKSNHIVHYTIDEIYDNNGDIYNNDIEYLFK